MRIDNIILKYVIYYINKNKNIKIKICYILLKYILKYFKTLIIYEI